MTSRASFGVTGSGWAAFALAALVIALDQAMKHWVLTGLGLAVGESRPMLWPLSFTLVRNDGISFGFFQTHAPWTRWALAAFALAVSLALIAWVRRADRLVTGVAGGLILGGAVGNLIDRVRLGAVVDFVDVHPLVFPWIFNIADSGITVGVIILLAENLLAGRRARA
ncbi:MAG TPA: signal peptidase II [Caulobacteraceae bacterium]|nr:signal peptidase II [Caulobacteraceae bacterium]